MTKRADEKLTIEHISVEQLTPNPWNPNRMKDEMRAKLKVYIEREGLVEPLVVRPIGGGYEILGGFHRWGIAKELGYENVPCVVVDLDDRRAKILSVNLNEMKGQSAPNLLANLVHDLSRELTLDDLETQLPYSEAELRDSLELLKIPDGLETLLETEAEEEEKVLPRVMSFVLTREQEQLVERAVELASDGTPGRDRKARGLANLATHFLEDRRDEVAQQDS